jgi:hypothetical protein
MNALKLAVLLGLASASAAQESPSRGGLLLSAIRAVANGQCQPDRMSDVLLRACNEALPSMQLRLSMLGEPLEAVYKGTQATPGGDADVFVVRFQRGYMNWIIGTAPDGKINVLWTP